jgi:hypothetical protein
MKRLLNLFPVLLLSLLGACASPSLPAGTPIGETMEADSIHRFSVVDATPAEFFNRTVLVEADVVSVCAKAGCWMQIEDEGKTALVRWETGCGGQYKFPMDAIGKRILIQGSFYPKELTEEDRLHMEEEAGTKLDIRADPYEFNASSVMIMEK